MGVGNRGYEEKDAQGYVITAEAKISGVTRMNSQDGYLGDVRVER